MPDLKEILDLQIMVEHLGKQNNLNFKILFTLILEALRLIIKQILCTRYLSQTPLCFINIIFLIHLLYIKKTIQTFFTIQ